MVFLHIEKKNKEKQKKLDLSRTFIIICQKLEKKRTSVITEILEFPPVVGIVS